MFEQLAFVQKVMTSSAIKNEKSCKDPPRFEREGGDGGWGGGGKLKTHKKKTIADGCATLYFVTTRTKPTALIARVPEHRGAIFHVQGGVTVAS